MRRQTQEQNRQVINYDYDVEETSDNTYKQDGQRNGTMQDQLAHIHGQAVIEHPPYGDRDWEIVTTNELAQITRMTTMRQYRASPQRKQGGGGGALALGVLMFVAIMGVGGCALVALLSRPEVLALVNGR